MSESILPFTRQNLPFTSKMLPFGDDIPRMAKIPRQGEATVIIGVVRADTSDDLASLTPEMVERLTKAGHQVLVVKGGGARAGWRDRDYEDAGARVVEDGEAQKTADVLTFAEPPSAPHRFAEARPGTLLVGMIRPHTTDLEVLRAWCQGKLSAVSLDAIPRLSRAQGMDVLSSLSTVMGYRAVMVAAERLRKFFPLLMTAAGTIPPARVLVLGAGVAGLQAIATAHRLGAVVEAFDTRPEVKEQVESVGGRFLTVDVQSAGNVDGYAEALDEAAETEEVRRLAEPVARADVVITTAQIPGKRAPILITQAMVERMRPESVIVDLAALSGGNTELTVPDNEIVHEGVHIVGLSRAYQDLAGDASRLYAKNLTTFLEYLVSSGMDWDQAHQLNLPEDDELVGRTIMIHQGNPKNPVIQERLAPLDDPKGCVADVPHR